MAAALAVGGWVAASFAAVLALIARRSLAFRMEAVLRACHELRGPLAAAQLGLELSIRTGEASLARLRAIDLELSRAALALDDLARDDSRAASAPGPAFEPVDVAQLLEDCVASARAGAYARGVRAEDGEGAAWPSRARSPRVSVADSRRLRPSAGRGWCSSCRCARRTKRPRTGAVSG